MTGAPSSIPKPQPSSGGDVTSSSSGSSGGSGRSVRLFAFLCLVGVPYLVGIFISQTNIDEIREIVRPIIDIVVPPIHSTLRFLQPKQQDDEPPSSSFNQPSTNTLNYIDGEACYERFMNFVQRNLGSNDSNPLEQLQFELYRHGEPEPCGNVVTPNNNIQNNFKQFFLEAYANNNECNDDLFEQKYLFENLVTQMIHYTYQGSTCHSKEKERTPKDGFYGFCDMGEARTPILSDHKQLRPITTTTQKGGPKTYLPCHFHDEYGVRVASLSHLIQMARDAINNKKQTNHPTSTTDCSIGMDGQYTDDCHRTRTELQFYAVPAGRVFIHSAKYVGQIIQLPHVSGGDPEKPVYMKVISTQPKVFDVFNFFTHAESDDLVQRALAETSETHRIKRSSTGATGYNLNDRRTSESGYDTNGATSVEVKKRCFKVLGFDEYIESHADGLQILRYNLTKAYIPHLDWIDGNDQLEHDYESEFKGGNRYATILLYFTDLEENDGGETVFTETWPDDVPVEKRKDFKTALRELRESPQGSILKQDSWEENMVAKCRSRLAIRPQSARAVLFYSQLPNGRPDHKSLHGGCPVLNGTKYAANLWVWNTPRDGYEGNPKNPNFKGKKKEEHPGKVTGVFKNSANDPEFANAELYYIDQFWGKLGHGDPVISVNTYPTHVWNVKVNGVTKKTFEIKTSEPDHQEFIV